MKNLEPSIKISVFFEAVLEECRVKISFFYQKLIAHLQLLCIWHIMRIMRKTCLLKFSTNIPFPITCIYFLCVREAFIKYYFKNSFKREEGEEAIDEENLFLQNSLNLFTNVPCQRKCLHFVMGCDETRILNSNFLAFQSFPRFS